MKRETYIILVTIATAAAVLALLPGTAVSEESAQLHINLKKDDILLPETKGDPGASSEEIYVEADYDEPIWGGVRSNKRWVDVGTWISSSREIDCEISGDIFFNVWYEIIDEGYIASPEFRYTLRENGNIICQLEAVGKDPGNDDIVELVNNTSLSEQTIEEDSTLDIYIEYRGFEDCRFHFDSANHDAGFKLESDFLHLFDMNAEKDEVELEVYDAFNSNWNSVKNYMELKIDGNAVDAKEVRTGTGGTHDIDGSEVTGTIIKWELDEELEGGEEVEIWVKYTPAGSSENKGMKKQCNAKGADQERPVANISSIDPNPARDEEEVTFDGSDSYDEDGSIEVYAWRSDLDGELFNGSDASFVADGLSAGTHEITLVVSDNDDLWSKEVTATLEINSNAVPEVSLSSPHEDETIMEVDVTLSWEGSDDDDDPLTYDVYLDLNTNPATLVEQNTSKEYYQASDLTRGETYYWKVVASDGRSDIASDVWNFTVLDEPPEVTIQNLHNGQKIQDVFIVEGTATDDVEVVEILVRIDLGNWIATEGTENWQYTWDTSSETNGEHTLQVKASDGHTESDAVSVKVMVDNKDEDDDDFEIAGMDGYVVVGGTSAAAAVIALVAVLFVMRGRREESASYHDCGSELHYIDAYDSWYCYECEEYQEKN